MTQTTLDLPEDKPSATSLVAQIERLTHALDATESGIWDWNCLTGEMFFSPPWYRLLGYEPGGLPGRAKSFFDRIHPEDAERAQRDLEDHLAGRTSGRRTEMRLRTKSGEFRWFLDQGKVVARDESGRPTRLVGALTDITERKRAERERERLQAQLVQSQKMDAVGALAGGIAHDFNNILTGILGFVDLVREDLPADHITRPWLEDVVGAGERAKALLQQILNLSRSATCRRTPFHLEEAIIEAMGLIRAGLPATVRLEQETPFGSPPILGDPAQIHQVLMALTTNALQSLPAEGGTIMIGLTPYEITGELAARHPLLRAGPGVRLTVSDNGSGMNADTLGRIFEPFFTTKKTGTGTGLGLAIVYGIIQAHAGAIEAQSAPGRGTTFALYFSATPFAPDNPDAPGWADLPKGNGELILHIEDDALTSRATQAGLTRLGYRLTSFTKPAEASVCFAANPDSFDLVLAARALPEFSGENPVAHFLERRPQLPVVLLTGPLGLEQQEALIASGVREVLVQPSSMEALARTVARHLQPRSATTSPAGQPPAGSVGVASARLHSQCQNPAGC